MVKCDVPDCDKEGNNEIFLAGWEDRVSGRYLVFDTGHLCDEHVEGWDEFQKKEREKNEE